MPHLDVHIVPMQSKVSTPLVQDCPQMPELRHLIRCKPLITIPLNQDEESSVDPSFESNLRDCKSEGGVSRRFLGTLQLCQPLASATFSLASSSAHRDIFPTPRARRPHTPRHRRLPLESTSQPLHTPFNTPHNRNHGQLPRLHLRNGARQSQLLLLLQDRRVPPRRPLLAQTRQALVLADDPAAESLPEPRVRPQEQDEPAADADAL